MSSNFLRRIDWQTLVSRGSVLIKQSLACFAIASAAASLMGCQNNDKGSVQVQNRMGYPRTTSGVPMDASTSGLRLNGVVFSESYTEEEFRDYVQDLMEASMSDREMIGYVSPLAEGNTGVFFGGRVQLRAGPLQAGMRSEVAPNSRLVIGVFDMFPDVGQLPPLPQPFFVNAVGTVEGNEAHIRFEDDNGFVELIGTFDNQYFTGSMTYDVRRTVNGQTGRAGKLGEFQVPTCEFFVCR